MLNMVNGSIHSELSRFFQVIQNEHITSDSVTPAAFCKARKKFSYTAFKSLNTNLVETFYDSEFVKRWNGLRLLAVVCESLIYLIKQKFSVTCYFIQDT